MGGYASPVPTPAYISDAQMDQIVADVLDQVEEGQSYTHPATHPATMITEDATHRFATDTEKGTWNGKQNALGFTPANENHTHTEYAAEDHDHGLTYAAYAHAHTGVYAPDGAYEPALESPMADGYVLSSDMAGNRSWIAPGGGGGLTQSQILTRML